MSFTVINSETTMDFLKNLYIKEVLSFTEDMDYALLNRKELDKLISIGKDLYLDLWKIIEDNRGSQEVELMKYKYKNY